MMNGEITYMFIERNAERAKYLQQVVDPMRSGLPKNCRIQVFPGTLFGEGG